MLCIRVVGASKVRQAFSSEQNYLVSVAHGSQTQTTPVATQTSNPRWGYMMEIWDREKSETIELTLLIQHEGRLWKHSNACLQMETYRMSPEKRFRVVVPLKPIAMNQKQDEVWGELQLLISYTDDVDQPSVFTFLTCGLLTCDMATSIEQYVGHASPKTIRKVSNPVSRGTDGSTPRPLQVSNNS